MSDFTRRYETVVDAPVHDVFEYCRDPRHLFQGWPALELLSRRIDGDDGPAEEVEVAWTLEARETTLGVPARR